MAKYVTELAVSLNVTEESQLRAENFKVVPGNLNQGAGGNTVRLWYKKGSTNPITRIQFSFTENMAKGLSDAGYRKINKDLDAGTGRVYIYLWYFCGTSRFDVPIHDLHISHDSQDGAQRFKHGWEKMSCNLNKFAGGENIFLFVKRTQEVYICDITATSGWESHSMLFNDGYTRMDQNTNEYDSDDQVFIWYRQSTEKDEAIQNLELSDSDMEYNNLQAQGYTVVNMNLTKRDGGNPVFLWYIKSAFDPISSLTYVTSSAKNAYKAIGAEVREPSMHGCWGGDRLYLTFYQ